MFVDQGKYDGLLIAGDFNFPNLVWSSEHYFAEVNGSDSCFASVFLDLLNDESIVQHVNFPTFVKSDLSCANFLDLILSEAPERISDFDKLSPLGTANQGHLAISWHYHLKSRSRQAKTTSKKFVYRKGNYDKFNSIISSYDWSLMFSDLHINDCYNIFLEAYNAACSACIPMVAVSTNKRTRSPWMTQELLQLLRIKNNLFHKNLITKWKHADLVLKFKSIRAVAKKLIKRRKIEFEMDLASDKKNPKRLYSYINSKIKINTSIDSMYHDNFSQNNHTDIANILNNQFQSVFNVDSSDTPLPDFPLRTEHTIGSFVISFDTVFDLLNKLDPNKSSGCDMVHSFVLKHTARSMSIPLTILFRLSLHSGSIPSYWSLANITPLFKNGSRSDPSNYRPISLTSVICKLMEKLVKHALFDHLFSHNLLSPKQHGFLNNKACVTNLLEPTF